MKRSILTAAMLFLTTIFVSAQDRPAQVVQKVEQVASQLNLTPAQRAEIIPILKAEAPKVRAIKNNTSLSPMQKMEQLRALHQQTDPQMKSILTPEQYQTLKDIRRQEIEQAMRNRQNQ
jgi:Spy/CpxP family protein refolding chaperone